MPPPSPTRKEDLLVYQQRRSSTASPTNSEAQRRGSVQTTPAMSPERSPERKQTTTATYMKQYLQRRRSQCEDDEQLQSPRDNGCRPMERRRSSEDAGAPTERLNGLALQSEAGKGVENGHHHSVAALIADTTVEKMPMRTTDPIEDVVAAVSGKGIAATNDSSLRTIDQDQSATAASKVTMAKKRKAPCGRSTVVLVVVAGVVAGGIAVCRMYPSSPAATSIRVAADRAKEGLYALLVELQNEVGPYTKDLGEVLRAKWLELLRNGRLGKAARAMEVLAHEEFQKLRGSLGFNQPAAVVTVCFGLMESMRGQLRLSVSSLVDALKLSVEWMKAVFMELFERARALLLTALSSFAEALKQGGEWSKSSLDLVFEWLGLESDLVSDVNLPSEHFLASLVTHQAAIQDIGRGLTTQESQALHDVKRFEKRRVTIASATNSIIADTRVLALEGVVDVKMAAMEFIEERSRELAEQYARAFEQALKEYERTSRQVEEEGGSGMLAAITTEIQAQIDAVARLKRDLTLHEMPVDEKPTEPSVLGDQTSSKDESRNERATEDQSHVDGQIAQENQQSGGPTESPVLEERSLSEDVPDNNLDNEEESQIVIELAKEDLMPVELTEVPAMEHSFPKETLESEHVSEDQTQIVAQLAENDFLDVTLESTDKEEVTSEVKETFITEVLVDLENAVLEVEHTQMEVTKLLKVLNLSEGDISKQEVELQQEDRVEVHFRAPVDGAGVELVVEFDTLTDDSSEQVEVKQLLPDVRTRVATQAGIEKEDNVEKQKKDMAELMQEDAEEMLLGADTEEEEVQSEQLDAETVLKVEVDVDEAEAVFAELQLTGHSHDEDVSETEIQTRHVSVADETQRERTGDLQLAEDANAATLTEIETLETECVVVAKEIQQLEELEQVLLQEEGERAQVEEELRLIAEEEGIWLQTKQVLAEGEASREDAVPGQHNTATIYMTKSVEAVADFKTDGRRSSVGIPALPRSALMQIGLLSVVFLGLAMLAAYLFVRHHKHGFLARAPRRRRRWQRLADMDESEAEEVVLLPDDSSDEDDDTDVAVSKEASLDVLELMPNAEVEATDMVFSGGEEAGEEEKTSADHEDVEEEEEELVEEEEENVAESDSESTVVVKTKTYKIYHPVTSNSDASADDGDSASVSVTTPPASRQETPDTSQRTRRQRRGIRT